MSSLSICASALIAQMRLINLSGSIRRGHTLPFVQQSRSETFGSLHRSYDNSGRRIPENEMFETLSTRNLALSRCHPPVINIILELCLGHEPKSHQRSKVKVDGAQRWRGNWPRGRARKIDLRKPSRFEFDSCCDGEPTLWPAHGDDTVPNMQHEAHASPSHTNASRGR
jgi:hypothetical protein